jgi:hypothetical protein
MPPRSGILGELLRSLVMSFLAGGRFRVEQLALGVGESLLPLPAVVDVVSLLGPARVVMELFGVVNPHVTH